MRSFFLIITLIFLCALSYAQESDISYSNDAYLEIGGAGLFSSINYERQLSAVPGFSIRGGLGFYSEDDLYITYNVGLHFLFSINSKKNAFIDLGLGASLAREYIGLTDQSSNADIFINIVPGISFRKYFREDIFFRIGINPVMNEYGLTPWANLALGKRF